jgi:hypothetical protein
MAAWLSAAHLADHFHEHGHRLGCQTNEEYGASAQATLSVGRDFSFSDDWTGEDRLGCFDHDSGRPVVLTDDIDDPRIVSHVRATDRYCHRLWNSTLDVG